MAGRTSTSIGVGVTVTLLAVTTLALFVTSVIFFANKRAAERQLADAKQTTQDYVSDQDRASDAVNRARDAGKSQRMTAIAYLLDNQQKVMQVASGSRTDTLDDLRRKLDAIPGSSNQNMLTLLRARDASIDGLNKQLGDAVAARDRALNDRENEVRRVRQLEENQRNTIAQLNTDLDKYRDEVERYRDELNQAKADMDERVSRIQDSADSREAALRADIDTLQRDKVLNQALITRLQDELKGKRVSSQDEYALVDGEIISVDPAARTAVISRGRRDKIVLGMTFAVYAEATAIRPDPQSGEYPAGKATIEIIKIDERTATARILRETRGNPVVRGDVIANAVYDPRKTYKFMVYGNFDADGDGRATFEEQANIRARIEAWGGQVLSELTGDTDFLVLGEPPVLPPEPPGNAPIEVINFYVAIRRQAERYNALFNQAQSTSIPVLNQNRLFTLTGDR